MTESVGNNAIPDDAANASEAHAVHTLAHVLDCEFHELHESDPRKEAHEVSRQGDKAAIQTKDQQPIADPSLAPADDQGRDDFEKQKIAKTPSQQPDTDKEATGLRSLWENVHSLAGDGRTAICLSGGGVRSAAFNLGVLQGLARLELLNRFHYLSTVSGGGYIGCWLSAWRHRCEKGLSDISRGLSWPDRIGNAEVPPRVPDAISNLRRATNYLTPVKGILSPDTWTTITIVGRNLILNHLIIVPLIAAILLFVKIFGAAAHADKILALWENWVSYWIGAWLRYWFAAEYLGSLLLPGFFVALGWIIFSVARPSWDVRRALTVPTTTPHRESLAQIWAPRLGILFVLFGALIFGFMAAKEIPQGPGPSAWNWWRFGAFPIGGAVGALLAFVLALGVATVKRALCKGPKTTAWTARVLGHVPEVPPGPITVPTAGARAVFLLALAASAAGGAGGLLVGAGEELAAHLQKSNPWSTALILSVAPLWLVISYNVGDAVFLGLTVRRASTHGKPDWSDRWGDEEREWVARIGGYLTVIALGITILCLLSFFGPELIKFVTNFSWTGPIGLAAVGILSALASIGLAASPFSTHFGAAPLGVRLPVRSILAIATPIFAGLLTVILSTGIDSVLFGRPLLHLLSTSESSDIWFDPRSGWGQLKLFGLALFLVVFSYRTAGFVNINRFSLYDLYRMRLTREFLGASNRQRRPDVWTGFDETDDIPLNDVWPPQTDNERRLYPVINAALNMAATKRLEWQERKAVSFVFTPRYCGSGATPDLGFRETKDYANGIRQRPFRPMRVIPQCQGSLCS